MNDFLPSRKVIAFLLVPIVTIFLLWAVNAYYSTPAVKKQEEDKLALVINKESREFEDRDTDSDGLKDWEEFLYQTDERNPDTDGDGVFDGVEVNRGYDPLTIGNGSSSDDVAPQKESDFNFYKEDPNLSKTDVLARDIFIAYAELKDADALEVQEIRDNAIEKAINDNADILNIFEYTNEDIVLSKSTGASAARAYRAGYQESTSQLLGIVFSEIDLFARHVQQGDDSALVELQKNKEAYRSFIQSLQKVPVPGEIQGVHLELLNNTEILVFSISQMQLIEQDPLLALV